MTYPEFPESKIEFDTKVSAVNESEWTTEMSIRGSYDGPTDVVAVKDYKVVWKTDGQTLFEEGSATLVLAGGGSVASAWTSSIVSDGRDFRRLPASGEVVRVDYSRFQVDGDTMSYDWKGTVAARER